MVQYGIYVGVGWMCVAGCVARVFIYCVCVSWGLRLCLCVGGAGGVCGGSSLCVSCVSVCPGTLMYRACGLGEAEKIEAIGRFGSESGCSRSPIHPHRKATKRSDDTESETS